MRNLLCGLSLLTMMGLIAACASSVPPSRILDYMPAGQTTEGSLMAAGRQPLEAALLLVSDTAAPDAAPNLPEAAKAKLGEELKQEITRVLPVRIKAVISGEDIRPFEGSQAQFSDLAKQHGVDYLAVVVMSSTEQEYPVSLFLGWTTHMQPGYRRDNWSLLELALLDAHEGTVLLRGEGRAWATLDRPTAPGINQWYPVIYLRPQEPERPIWPPTFEGAPYTLRVVSFNQAAKRLTLNLQHTWLDQMEAVASVRPNS